MATAPSPRRRPHQQQRHRHADQPPCHQHRLATDPIRQCPGEEVRGRFDRAERHDERERGGERGQPEHVLREQRQHRPLLADHAPDQRVDRNQQQELRQVLA
jgi:hypothetical protein